MPKISVIVPVYKAENYLHDCIDSILSQTFSDFDLILVDDGSPDNSGAICQEYAAKDSRITVLHQKNQGQAAARNHALPLAKGQWICYVDSDDLIHPQTLELLLSAAEQTGAAISMCRMLEAPEVPEEFFAQPDPRSTLLTMDEETLVSLHDAGDYPAWVACAKLIKRELIESYPFTEGRVYEDNEAVCRWVVGGKTLASLDAKLYFYRTTPGSTTQRSFSLKKLDYLWALDSILSYYSSLGYLQMRNRFFDRYAEESISVCYGLRNLLKEPGRIPEIEKRLRAVMRRENLSLTKPQFEAMLDAAHPRLIRLYWPVSGMIRRLKSLPGKEET